MAPGKSELMVLDFVPANCRHSLVQAVDIFSRDSQEVLERARRITQQAGRRGSSISIEKALELARQEQEAAEADVSYQLRRRDPFAAIGISLAAPDSMPGAPPATPEQRRYLSRAGLPAERLLELSAQQAEELCEALRDRKAVGLCTPRQARELLALGIDPRDLYFDEARSLLREQREGRR